MNRLRCFALLLMFSGCGEEGSDPGTSTCGDGACNAGESASSCPSDCMNAVMACGDGTCAAGETCTSCRSDCGPCCTTTPDSCTGENACIGEECISAFGRNYQITVRSGMLTTNDENGETWDAAGGLPDALVALTLNNTAVLRTGVAQDTISPVWNESATAVVPAGSTFVIEVFDSDLAVDDPMFGCQASPLTADFLRNRTVRCEAGPMISGAFVEIDFVRP